MPFWLIAIALFVGGLILIWFFFYSIFTQEFPVRDNRSPYIWAAIALILLWFIVGAWLVNSTPEDKYEDHVLKVEVRDNVAFVLFEETFHNLSKIMDQNLPEGTEIVVRKYKGQWNNGIWWPAHGKRYFLKDDPEHKYIKGEND
jgi:hypothetical protein